jgi:hypothetical protein
LMAISRLRIAASGRSGRVEACAALILSIVVAFSGYRIVRYLSLVPVSDLPGSHCESGE